MYCNGHFCPVLTKYGFSQHVFIRVTKYQILRKSVQREALCCMRSRRQKDGRAGRHTGGHDEDNWRFWQLCERI